MKDLGSGLETAKLARAFGPQATMAILGDRKYADLAAVVDERGTLTYKQIDDQSWALAHGLQRLGVSRARSSAYCAATIAVSSSPWPPAARRAPEWC